MVTSKMFFMICCNVLDWMRCSC